FPKGFALPTPKTVTAAELDASLASTLVIDLDTSLRYRDGHVPGAWFAVRAGLGKTIAEMLKQQAGATRVVLVSPDSEIAALAAPEAEEAAGGLPVAPRACPAGDHKTPPAPLPVAILAGGMKVWRDAKLPVETGHVLMADPPTDV